MTTKIKAWQSPDRLTFEREIEAIGHPVLLTGLIEHWPAFSAARQSAAALANYLKGLDRGQPVGTLLGPPAMQGRYFYDSAVKGFNFERRTIGFAAVINKLIELEGNAEPMAIYAGSVGATDLLPDFAGANPLPILASTIEPRLWLGNRSRIAAHYDIANNIACVVCGKRRFTLFPPDQIGNLYIGPLDVTMAGSPASMVDFANPDFERFPKFRQALDAAIIVDMEPGDALFIPALWWHHVEAEGPFNLLVNYWWPGPGEGPAFESMALAMFGIRDRAPAERAAWKAFFDHYVFGEDAAHAGDHVPEHARSVLGLPSEERSRKMLQFVMARLSQR